MKFGHFDDKNKEYVIETPCTPSPWINYLGQDHFFSLISNTAGGYSFDTDAKMRRLTRYRYNEVPADMDGRHFYVKEGSLIWSPSYLPVKTPLDSYSCRHGLGYTIISGEKNELAAEMTFFVPHGESCEIQKIHLTNKSKAKKVFSFFAMEEWCLWNASDDGENFQRNLSTGEVECYNGIIYHKTEFRERRNHYAFYYVNHKTSHFESDRDAFLGMHNGFDHPAQVIEGNLKDGVASGWHPIAAHQIDLELEAGESKDLIFILGYCEIAKGEAKFDLTFMLTNPDVTEYWDGTWGIQPEGWYEDQNIDGDNFQVMANNNMGLNGEVFMEYWFWNAATSGYVLYQKVTLPEGAYQMTGRLAVNFDNQPGTVANVTFSANDVDGTQIAAGTLQDASVEFINKEEQEVKIGMKAHEGNQARWMAINKIHLYKIAPKPFEISENETYDYTQSGAGNVELTRTIKEGLNSVVLPFQMSAEDIVILGGEGAVAYTVAGIEGTSLKLAKAESVLANVPFFLKATEAGSEFFFEDKTIVAGEPVATVGVVQAVGTYETITVPTMNNCFVLSNGKFYGVDSEVSLKPTRAYIQVTPTPQDVKVLTVDVEDATAIEAIESAIANTQVYDLSGRKVQSPTRGLYIANGKKILVK